MQLMAVLYAEFKRLEEELHRAQGAIRWDEHTHQYFLMLKQIFRGRR